MGTNTTQLTSQKVDFWINGVDLVTLNRRSYSFMIHAKTSHIIHHILEAMIIMVLLVMVGVVLVLGPPTYITKNIILTETGMMGSFRNLRVIAHDPPRCYLLVGVIQLVLRMVPPLVLVPEMVNLVWILGPYNLPPRMLIVGLVVAIFIVKF